MNGLQLTQPRGEKYIGSGKSAAVAKHGAGTLREAENGRSGYRCSGGDVIQLQVSGVVDFENRSMRRIHQHIVKFKAIGLAGSESRFAGGDDVRQTK